MSKKEKTIEELLVPEEEKYYEIPDNWVWVRFGGLIKESKLGLVKSRKEQSSDNQYPYVKMNNITIYGQLDLTNTVKVNCAKEDLLQNELRYGDFLFNTRNSAELVGKSTVYNNNVIEGPVLFNNNILRIRFLKNLIPSIFNYYLNSPTGKISLNKNKSSTTNVAAIYGKNLNEIPIPLPPLHEQKRIAEKVESLLNKIDDAKQLIEEVKESFELRKAAISEKAFRGDLTTFWREDNPIIESAHLVYEKAKEIVNTNKVEPFDEEPKEIIPKLWKWVKLGEVIEINPPRKKITVLEDEELCTFIPMPAVSDKNGKIEKPEEKPFSKVKKGYTFFLEDDILFAKITPCMENGKSAIAKGLKNEFGFGSTEFHVLRTNECINEKYIHYLIRSRKFRSEAKRKMTGAVGQQRVPKDFLVNYIFALPPKEEQDEIVKVLNNTLEIEEKAKSAQNIKEKVDLLKLSILSKAFRGELGTNDPTEENAIELLKEVLQEK